MLLPQEIRNHTFGRAIRGYATTEVDEYINFLADTMDSLNRENAELEQKLSIAMEKLGELQEREARVARLDTEMRRVAATLLHETEKQQKQILDEAHAYAERVIADADAHVSIQKKVREEIREEVLSFKNELYARYGQHIDRLEEISGATAKMAFEESLPAEPTPVTPVIAETVVAPEPEQAEAIEEIEETETLETPEFIEAAAEIEDSEATEAVEDFEEPETLEILEAVEETEAPEAIEDMQQLDLLDPIDDTEAINKELEEMMAGTESIWTDYTDAVAQEEFDPGFALPETDAPETVEETFFDEADLPQEEEVEVPAEEDDALLLQNLRRAFSVEFDTFEPSASAKKTQVDDADEFAFVENEAPKKRGFLSRLIGGDSDGE